MPSLLLDTTDLKLLQLLQDNSSLTTKELAQILHLTSTPVHERIKRLEREGIIRKYVALLDHTKLNKTLIVFCNIKLRQHDLEIGKKFVTEITALEEVTEVYNVAGEYDFMIKVIVTDMPAYQQFIMYKLGTIANIGSTQSVFVLGQIKNSTSIPLQ
ncbi:MAG: Lrp/AsnC family transcriptional regulator [Cytophagaceae bacterium]|jgi:Lrp/AsnC family leucine-responsive transcriptional regulator|nr:Lrp/AsnC family transcriptional regulator [Cytophagaceae bacterium]